MASWCVPAGLSAQEHAWNESEVLELVRRAWAARERLKAGSPALGYEARADGHVYFFLDREDGAPPIPLRVDQVSLDVTWSPSGGARQIIRAVRSRELLPIQEFRFYEDRLTISQDAYADEISVGEGRDVRGVPHPLGPAAEDRYDFGIGSVLTIHPANEAPRRIREILVRPRRTDLPGYIGSIHVDEASGSVVRMDFTFTEASYPDPRNDYVRVRLEHMLWEGGLWLPRTQVIEVRRESPRWDLPLGTVVRSRLEVSEYREGGPGAVRHSGPPVLVDPSAATDTSRFLGGLLDRMAAEELAISTGAEATDAASIERLARSGLPRLRPHADRISSVLRANRSEGVRLGAGASFTRASGARAEALVGYAFGSSRPSIDIALHAPRGELRPSLGAHWRTLRDVGWLAEGPDVIGSFGVLLSGEDRIDPYLVTGVEARLDTPRAWGTWRWQVSLERHGSAAWSWQQNPTLGRPTRPVRPIEPGTEAAAGVMFTRTRHPAESVRLDWGVGTLAGSWGQQPFLEFEGRWSLGVPEAFGSTDLEAHLDVAVRFGATPIQGHYFLGGSGTLPGHDWRAWAGTRAALLSIRGSRELIPTWMGVEAFASVGVAAAPAAGARAWDVVSSGPPRLSVGLGLTGFRGMLRLRLARGLGPGHSALFLSFDPSLRPLL